MTAAETDVLETLLANLITLGENYQRRGHHECALEQFEYEYALRLKHAIDREKES